MAAKRPSAELQSLLAEVDPAVANLALGLRSLVLEETPKAAETVFDAGYAISIFFSLTDRWQDAFCFVAVYARHVNLGFQRGKELADPEQQLQGKGKLLRHLKVRTEQDLRQPHLREFLRRAIEHAQKRD
jgi:hypothetical protein